MIDPRSCCLILLAFDIICIIAETLHDILRLFPALCSDGIVVTLSAVNLCDTVKAV